MNNYEPTAADWADFAAWCDAQDIEDQDRILQEMTYEYEHRR